MKAEAIDGVYAINVRSVCEADDLWKIGYSKDCIGRIKTLSEVYKIDHDNSYIIQVPKDQKMINSRNVESLLHLELSNLCISEDSLEKNDFYKVDGYTELFESSKDEKVLDIFDSIAKKLIDSQKAVAIHKVKDILVSRKIQAKQLLDPLSYNYLSYNYLVFDEEEEKECEKLCPSVQGKIKKWIEESHILLLEMLEIGKDCRAIREFYMERLSTFPFSLCAEEFVIPKKNEDGFRFEKKKFNIHEYLLDADVGMNVAKDTYGSNYAIEQIHRYLFLSMLFGDNEKLGYFVAREGGRFSYPFMDKISYTKKMTNTLASSSEKIQKSFENIFVDNNFFKFLGYSDEDKETSFIFPDQSFSNFVQKIMNCSPWDDGFGIAQMMEKEEDNDCCTPEERFAWKVSNLLSLVLPKASIKNISEAEVPTGEKGFCVKVSKYEMVSVVSNTTVFRYKTERTFNKVQQEERGRKYMLTEDDAKGLEQMSNERSNI